MGFFEFIRNNLAHVLPILLAGAFALAISIERFATLYGKYTLRGSHAFFEQLKPLMLSGKMAEAVALCDRFADKPLARVVKEGVSRAHQPEALIEHGLQIAVADASQAIQRRTSFLSTVANVATLLGLVGTIAGLIASFEAVGHADAQQKSALLAAGISTAMNATLLGLGVAIPCMLAFSVLMNKSNRLVAELEQAAIRTIDLIKQRYYAAEVEAAPRKEAA